MTLVARDAANLAIALCAASEDAAELWRSLATHINPSLNGATPAAEGALRQPAGYWVLLGAVSCAFCCWSSTRCCSLVT